MYIPKHASSGPQSQSAAHVASSAAQCAVSHEAQAAPPSTVAGSIVAASQVMGMPLPLPEALPLPEPLALPEALPLPEPSSPPELLPLPESDEAGEGDELLHPCAARAAIVRPKEANLTHHPVGPP